MTHPALALWFACTEEAATPPVAPAPTVAEAALGTVEYRWDPAAGDASVPPELGGPGFTGEGWTTRREVPQVAEPTAPRGGRFVTQIPDWPATFRAYGPETNTGMGRLLRSLTLQTLLELDPVQAQPTPSLATHWWISPDRRTFRFRLNPAARWSDGRPVTAQDVVATLALVTDPALPDPAAQLAFGGIEARAQSTYLVEFRAPDDRWTRWNAVALDLYVLPARLAERGAAAYLSATEGSDVGTGPYALHADDGRSMELVRREGWWMEDNPIKDGWFNFDRVRFEVVQDPALALEKVARRELDYLAVQRASWWAEDLPALDVVRRGLLVPQKFFPQVPGGFAGIALNQRRPPLDELPVRRALQMLFDRQTMIDGLLYREYEPLRSYFPNSPNANPDNPLTPYDERAAVDLLTAAGFTHVDRDGLRHRAGQPLAFTLTYASPAAERFLTLFQEACRRAGIRITLDRQSPAAAWKAAGAGEIELFYTQWSGELFPDPVPMWHSSSATQPQTSNFTGYRNDQVDALLERYSREPDPTVRADLLRAVDAHLIADVPYVLTWFPPSKRVVFWDRFGMPPWGTARTGPWAESDALWVLWWVDPDRDARVAAGLDDPSVQAPLRPRENHFWPRTRPE